MPEVSFDQLRRLRDFADELSRLASVEDQVGSPAAFYLKQIDKSIPDLVSRYLALLDTIESQRDA